MYAMRQKCRPKHQVLILNCYPRTTKGAVDVKPNSSELSYLLYYATTRRSKVQKVGAFLEKKTTSDVYRARIGNVQVTLQILTALIEKAPRDLPLFAPYVLQLLNIILRAHDITMVESSLPTFDSFCQHHDEALISADQEYLRQYEEIISLYASFASTGRSPIKFDMSAPMRLRWRSVGLQAIKSIVSSEAPATVATRQLDLIVPTLLENIWSDQPEFLDLLEQRIQQEECIDEQRLSRQRTSVVTVPCIENPIDGKTVLSSTTADADKLAEIDIGVLAIQCLKLIFVVNNKSQIHGATLATLQFILDCVEQKRKVTFSAVRAIRIFQMTTSWAPVQDRYIILVAAMDKLIQSPANGENIEHELILAKMVDSLLKSDINLIGLSVMDVLLGLIHHVLRILQLGRRSNHQASASVESHSRSNASTKTLAEDSKKTSSLRKKLLDKLQDCIGNLATHIYYADQISDMVSALIFRLKPGSTPGINPLIQAGDNPICVTTKASLISEESPDLHSDVTFFYDIAKLKALEAINSILIVAGHRKSMIGGASHARNGVSIQVWEGTQWLLRDSDWKVRKAYVATLQTWMKYEMTNADLLASWPNKDGFVLQSGKRVISNATQKEKTAPKLPTKSNFLELLHVAIYENALRHVSNEDDIILLHSLLTSLVEKLGVNAVKDGLPMIFCLHADIPGLETSLSKIHIDSLCYGYLWTICEKFKLAPSPVEQTIRNEIKQRQEKMQWVPKVSYPPIDLEQIRNPQHSLSIQPSHLEKVNSARFHPFIDRLPIVELISSSYIDSISSQSINSPTLINRNPNQATLSQPRSEEDTSLPQKIIDKMMSQWSREAVIAATSGGSKAASINGSKQANNTSRPKNFLSINEASRAESLLDRHTYRSPQRLTSRPGSNCGQTNGLVALPKTRHNSRQSLSNPSDSSHGSIRKFDQLKKVLMRFESGPAENQITGNRISSSASSESMISYAYTASEISFSPSQQNISPIKRIVSRHEPSSRKARSKSRDGTSRRARHLPFNLFSTNTGKNTPDNIIENLDSNSGMKTATQPRFNESTTIQDHISFDASNAHNIQDKFLISGTLYPGWAAEGDFSTDLENFLHEIDIETKEITGNVGNSPC